MTMSPDVEIHDEPDAQRYVAMVDGVVAGRVEYRLAGQVIDLVHTEVEAAYSGRGLAVRLARHALDDARRRDLRVRATCPFVASYIRRHPAYQDLVVSARISAP